jgi:hypothetical protein
VLDAAINIFDLSPEKWNTVRKTISAEQVRAIYEVVAEVWHPTTNYSQLLPDPGSLLRAIYLGEIDYLARDVFRFALYTDEIFIVDPFHKPHALQDKFNPLIRSEEFKADTLRVLHFLMEVEPWIRNGLVTLIPAPGDFDFHLRDQSAKAAEERWKSLDFKLDEMLEDRLSSKGQFRRFILNLPKNEWANKARELFPRCSSTQIEEICAGLERERKDDPLALDQPMSKPGSQMTVVRAGLNLETALYLSEEIGAFPYTSMKTRWRELLSARNELPEIGKVWSPLTHGFQDLDFTFLDNVDSRFAYQMRNDGRLESFRAFLRRAWTAVNSDNDLDKMDSMARDFRDELKDEYQKARAEWQQIDTDLLKWFGASLTGALMMGKLSVMPPALPAFGAATMGVFKLLESHRKRKQFRERIPMSIFIDLSTHRPKI